jgi:hypothetical protein
MATPKKPSSRPERQPSDDSRDENSQSGPWPDDGNVPDEYQHREDDSGTRPDRGDGFGAHGPRIYWRTRARLARAPAAGVVVMAGPIFVDVHIQARTNRPDEQLWWAEVDVTTQPGGKKVLTATTLALLQTAIAAQVASISGAPT